jgi:amino acid transporter
VAIAAVNLFGIRIGAGTQVVLMGGVVAGLLAVITAGAWVALGYAPQSGASVAPGIGGSTTQIGAALVFIFLAYGGWSDAATLSAEMRDPERGMKRALIAGMTLVTLLYLAVNWAFLRGLTSYGLAESSAPAADLMLLAFGRPGQLLIVLVVALTSITSMNAILISGARTTYAAARDNGSSLATLSAWNVLRGTPSAAILAISALALVLVAFGAYTRGGFATMVDFLSPVYWLFLTLSGVALFILRRRYPEARRPFRVPLYPWIPLAFVASSAYVFYSSLAYVKTGALVGIGVMLIGAMLLLALRIRGRQTAETPVSR